MLEANVAGSATNEEMAELARGSLRGKRDELAKALEGRVKSHHRFVLTELLCQIDSLEESITRFDQEIEAISRPFEEAIVLLDTIPGVARQTAEVIVAEIGIDMSRFPTADHLASWAGVAPGNNESGGKRRSGKTRKGNQHLRTALVQAANAAARTRDTYLWAQYQRLAPRRGHKRAIMAFRLGLLAAGQADPAARLKLVAADEGRSGYFLVAPGFDRLKEWNRSTYFALAVMLLAEQVAAGEGIRTAIEVRVCPAEIISGFHRSTSSWAGSFTGFRSEPVNLRTAA